MKLRTTLIIFCLMALLAIPASVTTAQGPQPNPQHGPPGGPPSGPPAGPPNGPPGGPSSQQRISLLVDTDTGVDDALALAYLLSQRRQQVRILGISAVAGNASVENAANNVLTVLDAAGQPSIPVIIGASAPLSRTLSQSGKLIHGPDGLWFVGAANPHNLNTLSRDVPTFYRNAIAANPGTTIIALGPLTNIARTIQQYPGIRSNIGKIVILGGSKSAPGNQTPVSEYNIWQDPEAANIVFSSGIPIEQVTLDAFTSFTVSDRDITKLQTGNPVARLLAGPLSAYAQVQTGLGGASAAAIPDATAILAVLEPGLATRQSALVDVIAEPRIVRGQTIIGIGLSEKIPMIADDEELSTLANRYFSEPDFDLFGAIGAILVRRPDNAQVILDINEKEMQKLFMKALTN